MPINLNDFTVDLCLSDIHAGDLLIIEDAKGIKYSYVCQEILNAGSGREEILLDVDKNIYFIWNMYIKGTSWVKKVWNLRYAGQEPQCRHTEFLSNNGVNYCIKCKYFWE